MKSAHRVAWELEHGPIPEGMCVLHQCDTPRCVRHLFLGTKLQNIRDMIAKGRHRGAVGVKNPRARLTEQDVREIQAVYDRDLGRGGLIRSRDLLSEQFSVSVALITKIQLGTAWRHLTRGAA